MTYTATTTLAAIRAKSPCRDGWEKLLAALGKTKADDEPLHLLVILNSNGLDDTLWVLDNTKCDERLARHISAWCAEQVLPIFEKVFPGDMRPRNAVAVARDDDATPEQRAAACDAAWAAACDAAGAAARAAARAACDAAWDAAWDAAGDAAWDAARAAAWDAACDAAGAAARAAARAAAGAAAGAAQERQLRLMLEGAK